MEILTAAISITGPFWCWHGGGGVKRRWRCRYVKSFQFTHLRNKGLMGYLTTYEQKKRQKRSYKMPKTVEFMELIDHILGQCPVSQAWRSCQRLTQSLGSGYSVWLDLVWWSWSVGTPSQLWERSWCGEDPGPCCSERWSQRDESREQRCGIALGFCPRSIRVSLKPLESSERLHHERWLQPPQKLCEKYLRDEGNKKCHYENTFCCYAIILHVWSNI